MPTDTPLKIFLACSELAPLAKTGGLADVSAALSAYFDSAGHDIRVLMPFYASMDLAGLEIEIVPELQDLELTLGDRSFNYWIVRARSESEGPDIYLLQCPELYGGAELYSGPDEHLRFILLCRAVFEMCQQTGFAPDIFSCHDWHTALVPIYLKTVYGWDKMFSNSKSVLTIHNIGYQGVFGMDILDETGVPEDKAIVVGDTTYDIQMAHRAGTDALAVCYGVHDRQRLRSEQPLDCVESFSAVIGWFS